MFSFTWVLSWDHLLTRKKVGKRERRRKKEVGAGKGKGMPSGL